MLPALAKSADGAAVGSTVGGGTDPGEARVCGDGHDRAGIDGDERVAAAVHDCGRLAASHHLACDAPSLVQL